MPLSNSTKNSTPGMLSSALPGRIKKTSFLLFTLLTCLLSTAHAQRFWVHNAAGCDGNWSNAACWSAASGGLGGVGAPTSNQNATFDDNSFSAPGQTVTLDVDGTCRDLIWTNATNNPTFTGAAARTLTIEGGNMALGAMTYTMAGKLVFNNSGNVTVNLGDQSKTLGPLVFTNNGNVTVNLGNQSKTLGPLDLHMAGTDRVITFNSVDDPTQTFTFGNIDIINENDLTINNTSQKIFGIISTTTRNAINISGTNNQFNGAVTLETPDNEDSNFNGINTFNAPVLINGFADNSNRVDFFGSTFNNTVTFTDRSRARFFDGTVFNGLVTLGPGTAPNVNDRINVRFLNNTTFNGGFAAGTYTWMEFGDPSAGAVAGAVTTFTGTNNVTFGDQVQVVFRRPVETAAGVTLTVGPNTDNSGFFQVDHPVTTLSTFNGPVIVQNNSRRVEFRRDVTFNGTFTVQGTFDVNNAILFNNSGTATFNGLLDIQATGTPDFCVRFENGTTVVANAVTIGNDARVSFNSTSTINGAFTVGNNARIRFTESNNGTSTFNGPVTFGDNVNYRNRRAVTFAQTVTSGNGGNYQFSSDQGPATFENDVTFGGGGGIYLINQQVLFPSGGSRMLTVGAGSRLNLDTRAGENTFNDLTLQAGAILDFNVQDNAGVQASTLRNLTLTEDNEILFTRHTTTTITGTVTANSANCEVTGYLRSRNDGATATVSFSLPQTWSGTIIRRLNRTGAGTVTVNNGVDSGFNTGFVFTNIPTVETFYWVGGTLGNVKPVALNNFNWNNPFNWSTSSGGPSGGCLPGPEDDVVFDANSFTNPASTAVGVISVQVNVPAFCRNMTWTAGVLNNPTFRLNNGINLTLTGSLELSPDPMVVTQQNDTDFIFTATTPQTIRFNGRTVNVDFTFNGAGGQWNWLDNTISTQEIFLEQGAINMGTHQVTATRFVANLASDLTRSLTLGAGAVLTLTGGDNTLDFRSVAGNFTLNADATSTMRLTRLGRIVLFLDHRTLTMPNLEFHAPGDDYTGQTVDISTLRASGVDNVAGDPAVMVTFRSITKHSTGGTFNIDNGGNNGANRAPKTFGPISIADGTTTRFFGPNNTTPPFMVYNGTVTFGNNTTNEFRGAHIFNQALAFGLNTRTDFHSPGTFSGNVSIAGTVSNLSAFNLRVQYIFNNPVTIGDGSFIRLGQSNTTFNGNATTFNSTLTAGDNVTFRMTNDNVDSTSTVFAGAVIFGDDNVIESRRDVLFNSTATFGNNLSGFLNGDAGTATFNGAVTIGDGAADFQLRRDVVAANTFTIGDNSNVRFSVTDGTATFTGQVTAGNGGSLRFQRGTTFNASGTSLLTGTGNQTIFNELAGTVSFAGDVTLGNSSDNSFRQSVTFATGKLLTLSPASSTIFVAGTGTFHNLLLQPNATVRFTNGVNTFHDFVTTGFNLVALSTAAGDGTVINNDFVVSLNCSEWTIIRSNATGTAARVRFVNKAQTWDNIGVQDLTVTGPLNEVPNGRWRLSINDGVNLSNLINTTPGPAQTIFITEQPPRLYYWVGRAGQDDPTTIAVDLNQNWNNPANWSIVADGSLSNPGNCIPNPLDNVVFNQHSFDAPNQNVIINIASASCRTMTWNLDETPGNADDISHPANLTGDANFRLIVFGDLIFDQKVNNQFNGIVEMRSLTTDFRYMTNIPAAQPMALNGGLVFDAVLTNNTAPYNWQLRSPISITDGVADLIDPGFSLLRGSVDANGQNISVPGNFQLSAGTFFDFDLGGSDAQTLTFNGALDNRDININTANYRLNSLVMDKATPDLDLRIINTPAGALQLSGDLTLTKGRLWNSDEANAGPFQIERNPSGGGAFLMADEASILLGDNQNNDLSTTFPTGFATYTIAAGSTTHYRDRGQQNVASSADLGGASYGNLVVTNGENNDLRAKELQGPISIAGSLTIGNNTRLFDMGHQITGNASSPMQMLGDGRIRLGSATSGTAMPEFQSYDLAVGTVVIYNGGVDQPIRGTGLGNTAGNDGYGNLWLINPNGAAPVANKSAEAPFAVRRTLRVESFNNLADAGHQIATLTNNDARLTVQTDATLTLGSASSATLFPAFRSDWVALEPGSTVAYISGQPQNVRRLASATANRTYSRLRITGNSVKTFAVTPNTDNTSNTVMVRDALLIEDNATLSDAGYQIIGTATGELAMQSNTTLVLGNATSATSLPTLFEAYDLDAASTVVYNSALPQTVQRLSSATATENFGNLRIAGGSVKTIDNVTPTKDGNPYIRVRGNLTVESGNELTDNGVQIYGENAGTITIGTNAILRLGTATEVTTLPFGNATAAINFATANLNAAPGATTATSTVIYQSGAATQQVAGGLSYGVLILSDPTASTTLKDKPLTGPVTILNDFTIQADVRFDDGGFQVTGQAGEPLTMEANTELALGANFPLNYANSDIDFDPTSKVVYYGLGDQQVRKLASATANRNYANLRIAGSGNKTVTPAPANDEGNNFMRVRGVLDLDGGALAINGSRLILLEDVIRNAGAISGSAASELEIAGNGPLSSALHFTTGQQLLRNLTLDRNAGTITLGTPLTLTGADALTLQQGNLFTTNTNLLSLDGSATITGASTVADPGNNAYGSSGGSENSHVNGPMEKTFNAGFAPAEAFRFPIGKGGRLQELGVAGVSSGPVSFRAEYFPSPSPDVNAPRAAGISHVSALEQWDLTKTNGAPGISAQVILHYDDFSGVGLTSLDREGLRIAHLNSGTWENLGNDARFITDSRGWVRSQVATADFSPFTWGNGVGANNPLPVTLSDFRATYRPGQGVWLEWQTATETNNAGFILSRAIGNAEQFVEIGHYQTDQSLRAVRNGRNGFRYSWLDDHQLEPGAIHYYLLQQMDTDGKRTSFGVRAVNVGATTMLYQNYPNPASNLTTFRLAVEQAGAVRLDLIDVLGRPVGTLVNGTLQTGTYEYTYDVSHLPAGVYFARLQTNEERLQISFSVVR